MAYPNIKAYKSYLNVRYPFYYVINNVSYKMEDLERAGFAVQTANYEFLFEINRDNLSSFPSHIYYATYDNEHTDWVLLMSDEENRAKELAKSPGFVYGRSSIYSNNKFWIPDFRIVEKMYNSPGFIAERVQLARLPKPNIILLDNIITTGDTSDLIPRVQTISFEEIAEMINNGHYIARFDFKPEYQDSRRNPSNYVATFYANDATVYLVELQYNQQTNQILPPQ